MWERERHRLGHSHEIPSMHKITIFRVSHKVWSDDKFSVDRQLHKTTYQVLSIYESFCKIVKIWNILEIFWIWKKQIQMLKQYFVVCIITKENFIGPFYWLVLFIVEIFIGQIYQYFLCLKNIPCGLSMVDYLETSGNRFRQISGLFYQRKKFEKKTILSKNL